MKLLIKLNIHPYYQDVWFTNSRILYVKQVSKIRDDVIDVHDYLGIVSYSESRSSIVIGCFNGDVPTLVHELSHACIDILEGVGMDVNIHTTEAFAYLIESLTRQCIEYL